MCTYLDRRERRWFHMHTSRLDSVPVDEYSGCICTEKDSVKRTCHCC